MEWIALLVLAEPPVWSSAFSHLRPPCRMSYPRLWKKASIITCTRKYGNTPTAQLVHKVAASQQDDKQQKAAKHERQAQYMHAVQEMGRTPNQCWLMGITEWFPRFASKA